MSLPGAASFEELLAWQRARELVRAVFEVTARAPVSSRFGYRDQLERAAISAMSNIAEGFERGSRAEFHRFLTIAKGSAGEVRSLIYTGLDANLLDRPSFDHLMALSIETSKVIGGLRRAVGAQR